MSTQPTDATMTDESLQAFLNLSDKEWAAFLPQITPSKRALYERMASVCVDLNMGVVPDGVMVCRPKCGGRHV